jgi:hypothetical protein
MFGLSLGKIVFTLLVIFAVWRAWKLVAPLIARLQAPDPPEAEEPAERQQVARPVELVECALCGTFVPKGTRCPSREGCLLKRG